MFSPTAGCLYQNNQGANWIGDNQGTGGASVNTLLVKNNYFFVATNDDQGIYRSTGYSNHQWLPVNTGLPTNPIIHFPHVCKKCNSIFAIDYNSGNIYSSTNDGSSWQFVSVFPDTSNIESIATTDSDIFAAVGYDGVLSSADGGQTWTIKNNGFPKSIHVNTITSSDSALYAGTNIGLYMSTDNGSDWISVNNGLVQSWVWDLGVQGNNIYAGGNGTFLTSNLGSNWSTVMGDMTYSVTAIGNKIFAGTGYGLFASSDSGITWTLNTGSIGVGQLIASGGNLLGGAGEFNGLYISTDSGTNWVAVNSPSLYNTVGALNAIGNKIVVYNWNYNPFQTVYDDAVSVSYDNGDTFTVVDTGFENVGALYAFAVESGKAEFMR